MPVYYATITVKVDAQDPADALTRLSVRVESPDGRDGGARVVSVQKIESTSPHERNR